MRVENPIDHFSVDHIRPNHSLVDGVRILLPLPDGHLRGGIKKKKLFFFSEKLRNSETPPPLSAIRKPQFFLIRKFRNWRDPPPFWRKIPKYSQFFFDKIPMDWVRTPFFGENTPISPFFMITPFWNRWDPPPFKKKIPKKSQFFLIRKFRIRRDPSPPLSEFF